MKSIINIFCVACLLGLIGCSHDYVQTDDAEKAKPVEVAVAAYDTTYLNLGVENAGFSNDDTKQAAAAMMQLKAVKTRALVLDGKGHVEDGQSFPAICFLRNKNTGQLGRFNLTWNVNAGGLKLVGNKERAFAVVWKKGTAPTSLSGDDWEVCAFAGGGQAMQKDGREVVSFAPDESNASVEGKLNVPFISDYSKVRILAVDGGQKSLIKFNFKLAGTLLKLKVKRDPDVSLDENFVFRTTGVEPTGVFSMQSSTGDNDLLDKAEWQSSLADGSKYEILLKGSNAVKLSEAGKNYFVWYVWGMPNKASTNVETTMVTIDGGYIIKYGDKQGPMVSTHNFTNDEGKIKSFNLSMHAPEPYPGFNFLNIMERVAEYNLDAAKHWWNPNRAKYTKDKFTKAIKTDASVLFTQEQASDRNFMPEGYHLPSLDEMTVLLPFTAVEKDRGQDMEWNRAFNSKTSPWEEKVTLYAYQDSYQSEGKDMWVVCDDPAIKGNIATSSPNKQRILDSFDDRIVETFKSYIWLADASKKIIYSIRFAENSTYGNKIRCAYKWDFTTLSDGNPRYLDVNTKGYATVTCRWIGDSPVTIDEITQDAWWNHNGKYNVVRELPASGEFENGKYKSIGQASQFLTSGKYNGTSYNRVFNGAWGGGGYGSFQRKSFGTFKGAVRPFKNEMMLKKK